jgi:diguanylate cyclase (GGDEF)-like protein
MWVSISRPRRRPNHRAGARSGARIPVIYGALALMLLGYLGWLVLAPRPGDSVLINGWGVDLFELVAGALCVASGLRRRTARAVPLIIGASLLTWTLGDVALTIESLGGATVGSPSTADAFYLAYFPLAWLGIALFIRGATRRMTSVNWLDGAVAGLGAATVCAAFAFKAVEHATGMGPLGAAVDLAYPLGDVLLLLVVAGGTTVLSRRRKTPWLLLAGGITINVVGDTMNLLGPSVGGSLGTTLNAIAWPTSILLMSMAMWLRPRPADPLEQPCEPSSVLPALAAAAALAILLMGSMGHVDGVAIGLATATILAVVLRTVWSIRGLRALTKERHHLSVTDHLTGLGNRRRLSEILDAFFDGRSEDQRRLAFLFIDLDGFKEVNDSFGHPAGDEILRQLGGRLTGSLRQSDLLVRLGGDEFAAVLIDADAEQAAAIADRLGASLHEPFAIDALGVQLGATIGIALTPGDAGDTGELMRCADLAMYRAKLAGEPFAFYEAGLDSSDRLVMAEELRQAIESDQLTLHYQPLLDLRSGTVVKVEALVRWPHPSLGLLSPLEFLPLAEEARLMGALTRWVLNQALTQCAAWHRAGRQISVSVNVSASDLLDSEFVGLVATSLARHELAAEALILEITETTVITEFERSTRVLQALRDLGVGVSLDDFGAGFTSLAYLGRLPASELKLDRSFIARLTAGAGDRDVALVRATIDLGHALGLSVVAEGIEDAHTLELLGELRCDLGQGYFVGRPQPALAVWFSSAVAPQPALMGGGLSPFPVVPAGSQQAAAGRRHPQGAGELLGV